MSIGAINSGVQFYPNIAIHAARSNDTGSVLYRALVGNSGHNSRPEQTQKTSGCDASNKGNCRPESSSFIVDNDTVEISSSAFQKAALDKTSDWTEQNPKEQTQVLELKAIDQKVRAHEMAHVSAGAGVVTSGATFSYTKGPDGKLYATGGEVQVDTSPIPGEPDATIEKAEQIQRAALAPMDPSSQDRAVAAKAAAMANQARAEKAQGKNKEDKSSINSSSKSIKEDNNQFANYNVLNISNQQKTESGALFDLIA
ncbi:MAG: hypothetical protein GY855_15550 [candidate division Zixibacteria bacterium]|nr:hypothetical protein [candidate division Zixibacteria bacterium]